MEKKKLQLEIFDEEGNSTYTHHLFFDVDKDYSLRLTIGNNIYLMDKNGGLIDD